MPSDPPAVFSDADGENIPAARTKRFQYPARLAHVPFALFPSTVDNPVRVFLPSTHVFLPNDPSQ